MGMGDWAINSYGLVLSESETTEFGKRYIEINDPIKYSTEHWSEANVWECVDYMSCIDYYSEFTGEAFKIFPNGRDDFDNSIIFSNDNCFIIELRKFPSLFEAAYKSYDNLLIELKSLYGEYLPVKFDYDSHVRHLVGTYWG